MRVTDECLECVLFLCVNLGSTERPRWHYGGTAFAVGAPSETTPGQGYLYLVTARHCIQSAPNRGAIYARINTVGGGSEFVSLRNDWIEPDDNTTDIAVLPFTSWRETEDGTFELGDDAPDHHFALRMILVDQCVDRHLIDRYDIGPGDDLLITGLFTEHAGKQQNLPIVRQGVLAGMPTEAFLDNTTGEPYRAYLAEVRSLGGLSGSPVFVMVEPTRDATNKHVVFSMGRELYLLGLIRGHFEVPATVPFAVDFGRDAADFNSGIAIVTPVDALLSMLNDPEEIARRRRLGPRLQ